MELLWEHACYGVGGGNTNDIAQRIDSFVLSRFFFHPLGGYD